MSKKTKTRAAKAKQLAKTPRAQTVTLLSGVTVPFMLEGRAPRDVQVEAVQKIEAAFRAGNEYVVLEAPTATGKSAMAATLGEYYGSSWVTTLTKQLQEQYLADFSKNMGMEPLYGRGHFTCARAGGGRTCADGATLFAGAPCGTGKGAGAKWPCPYKVAKSVAFEARHTIANGHSHLFNVVYPAPGSLQEPPDPRELLVVDEVQGLEGLLMGFVEVDIKIRKLDVEGLLPHPRVDAVKPYADWLEAHVEKFKAKCSGPDPVVAEAYRTLLLKIGGFRNSSAAGVEWVVESWDGGFTLKPINVHYWAPRFLNAIGKRKLLMSATIINAHSLVTSLGLDPEKGEFIQLGCPIPVAQRKVVIGNFDMKSSFGEEKEERKKTIWVQMAKVVDQLLDLHGKEKGLILTPSNELLAFIRTQLSRKNSDRLIVASGETREAKYNEHVLSKFPTVLGASGYWEGADLKGESSRFCIIPKVPWPMLTAQVKARKERERSWYEYMTVCKLVQGLGRSVRSETDYAISYVLDGGFRGLLLGKDSMIPPWLAEACVMAENDAGEA